MDEAERRFTAALERDPHDDATRAVYVDWLEERARHEDARLVRAQPPPRAFTRIVQRALVTRLRAVASRHGRWAEGCVIEIGSWRPESPHALVDDAERFLRTRRWDPEDGEPVVARLALLEIVEAVRELHVRSTVVPPPSGAVPQAIAVTELVVHTDGPEGAPPAPIDGVVTIAGGYLQYLGSGGSFLVALDAVDEERITAAAFAATAQPWEYDGAPDTARRRSTTTVRLTHSDPRRSRSLGAAVLTLSEHAGEVPGVSAPWRNLLAIVHEIVVPRLGAPTISWLRLAERVR